MRVIPAIDLLDGKCVRLLKGDFDHVTEYSDDPMAVVADFTLAGATRIHVVDLDAARDAPGDNRRIIKSIVSRADVEVEVAGGIRGAAEVQGWKEHGVGSVVIGTLAAEQPGELQRLAMRWPGFIHVALDARGELIATHGWQGRGGHTVNEMLELYEATPLAGFIYTDIERDGTMGGPDVEGLRHLVAASAHPVILSGGFSSIDDLEQARAGGAWGAIVGRAVYEGELDLGAAIAAVSAEGGA
ncbi:MAG: 1-(5-phosphoribosyl)-5-[(5-phosphoribosylamino)methylideneamino] imidazole-4-carboxamide isomerase [Candidatus Dormiibacterota bacterium]